MQIDDPEDDTPIDFIVSPPSNFVSQLMASHVCTCVYMCVHVCTSVLTINN